MKMFTKVALVTAMAISANAMAAQMQSLDDEALSAATGQDGITLTINTSGITIDKLLIHDNDGLKTAANGGVLAVNSWDPAANAGAGGIVSTNLDLGGTETAGAIVLNDVALNLTGATTVKIDTDAGAGGTAPFLNIGLQTGTTTEISVDNIAVGVSGTAPGSTGTNRRGATDEVQILQSYGSAAADQIKIAVGQATMNIQLGHAPQGAMIVASGVITNGIEIKNLAIVDASVNGNAALTAAGYSNGGIGLDRIRITDANSADLSANAKINATNQGLLISMGDNIKKDIYIDAVRLGDVAGMAGGALATTKSNGALEVQGLDMGTSSILVSGH